MDTLYRGPIKLYKLILWLVIIIVTLLAIRTFLFYQSSNLLNFTITRGTAGVFLGGILISLGYIFKKRLKHQDKFVQLVRVILLWLAFVQLVILLTWGLIIPVQYGLIFILLTVAWAFADYNFIRLWTIANVLFLILILFDLAPFLRANLPHIDNLTRIITSILLIISNIYLYILANYKQQIAKLTENLQDTGILGLLLYGTNSFLFMHTFKNLVNLVQNLKYMPLNTRKQVDKHIESFIVTFMKREDSTTRQCVTKFFESFPKLFKFKLDSMNIKVKKDIKIGRNKLLSEDKQILSNILFNLFDNAVRALNMDNINYKELKYNVHFLRNLIKIKIINPCPSNCKLSKSGQFHGMNVTNLLLRLYGKGKIKCTILKKDNNVYYATTLIFHVKAAKV